MRIVSKEEMYASDEYMINVLGVPSEVLMERAANGIFVKMKEELTKSEKIAVISGRGNNGGDGIALARLLMKNGYNARLLLSCDEEMVNKHQLELFLKSGFTYDRDVLNIDADVLVDAIFGIGLNRELSEEDKKLVKRINSSGARIFSVDIPSGVFSDKAAVDTAVKADITFTVSYPKLSAYMYPSKEYYGEIRVIDIGQSEDALLGYPKRELCSTFTLPKRQKNSHKGDNGKVLFVGGSSRFVCAPVLSAMAAERCGAGLITIAAPKVSRVVSTIKLMESTYEPVHEEDGNLIEVPFDKNYDVIALGMGLGREKGAEDIVKKALKTESALLLDADALFFLKDLKEELKKRNYPTVLTPHSGELARLVGTTPSEIDENRFEISRQFAKEHNVYLVTKGPNTIITTPDGSQSVNTSGNEGLAKGGSGDALSGMIAAFLAQYEDIEKAIKDAVFLHGHIADRLLEKISVRAISASEILEELRFIK